MNLNVQSYLCKNTFAFLKIKDVVDNIKFNDTFIYINFNYVIFDKKYLSVC